MTRRFMYTGPGRQCTVTFSESVCSIGAGLQARIQEGVPAAGADSEPEPVNNGQHIEGEMH